MKPKIFYTKKSTDLVVYGVLFALLVLYGIYIRGTCEELGCLAIIFPVIGIMILSVIEFFINLHAYSKKYHFTIERKIVFVISGIIAIFSILLFLFSLIN